MLKQHCDKCGQLTEVKDLYEESEEVATENATVRVRVECDDEARICPKCANEALGVVQQRLLSAMHNDHNPPKEAPADEAKQV